MRKISRIGFAVVLVAVILSVMGCAHAISAKSNPSHQASYDPQDTTEPTSGIWAIAPDGGRIVSQHYKDRYNALVDAYGDQFSPQLKHDDGFTASTWKDPKSGNQRDAWHVTKATHIEMGQMVQWKRDGRKPTGVISKILQKL